MGDYVNLGANVVAFIKDNRPYGMTCAWCMHCDYEELLLLIGSQSDTGKHLKEGDVIGISSLSDDQKDVAFHFGENHSATTDKFQGVSMKREGTALLVNGAKNLMVCQVKRILYLAEDSGDRLVHVKILKVTETPDKKFLSREDME